MFENLAAVFLTLTMAVVPASSLVSKTEPVQKDPIEKKQEYESLQNPDLPSANIKIDQIKKAPEQVVAPSDLDSWFKKYAGEYGVDENLLKKIAKCESGFNPGSNSGTYGGMFQFLSSTWSSTRKEMGMDSNPDLRFNAQESIRTSAFKISRGGVSSWPVCSK